MPGKKTVRSQSLAFYRVPLCGGVSEALCRKYFNVAATDSVDKSSSEKLFFGTHGCMRRTRKKCINILKKDALVSTRSNKRQQEKINNIAKILSIRGEGKILKEIFKINFPYLIWRFYWFAAEKNISMSAEKVDSVKQHLGHN